MIVLYTDKGYWTGFTFKPDYHHKDVKRYRTHGGAERASRFLEKRYKVKFFITTVMTGLKVDSSEEHY